MSSLQRQQMRHKYFVVKLLLDASTWLQISRPRCKGSGRIVVAVVELQCYSYSMAFVDEQLGWLFRS